VICTNQHNPGLRALPLAPYSRERGNWICALVLWINPDGGQKEKHREGIIPTSAASEPHSLNNIAVILLMVYSTQHNELTTHT
jgi:hypothetical protein